MAIRRTRVFTWVVVAAVVGALILAFRPRPTPVDVGRVDRGTLQVTIDEEGETRVHDRFVVSAPVAGRVLRIDLEPGDRVIAGRTVVAVFQPVAPALLDARTRAEGEARIAAANAAVAEARAAADRARTELAFAESELRRQRELDKEGLVAKERLEAAISDAQARTDALRAAESAVQTALRQREVAQASIAGGSTPSAGSSIRLTAPATGTVLRRVRESEAVVPAGEPLLEIGDPGKLEIVSDLLSTDAVRVPPGARVLIDRWGGDRVLEGVVRRVEPAGFTKISALGVEEQRVNVIIDFTAPAPALGDGYRVEVRIVVWESDGVLEVPVSSLVRDGDRWTVFVIENGRAVRRAIELGRRNSLEAEVRSGLREGDTVVVHPGDAVADGVRVEIRGA